MKKLIKNNDNILKLTFFAFHLQKALQNNNLSCIFLSIVKKITTNKLINTSDMLRILYLFIILILPLKLFSQNDFIGKKGFVPTNNTELILTSNNVDFYLTNYAFKELDSIVILLPKVKINTNSSAASLSVSCDNDRLYSTFLYNQTADTSLHEWDFSTSIPIDLGNVNGSCGGVSLGIANDFFNVSNSPTFYTSDFSNIYYWNGNNWVYTGHSNFEVDLYQSGGYGNDLYFLGRSLWHYDGSANPVKLVEFQNYPAVADVAVDKNGRAWVLTGPSWSLADSVKVFDRTGQLVEAYKFDTLVNTVNFYGSFIRDNQLYVGVGPSGTIFQDVFLPLVISGSTAEFGTPYQHLGTNFNDFHSDLASCNASLSNLNTIPDQNILVFPNPTNSIINLNDFFDIEVFEIGSKLVYKKNNCSEFDLSGFNPGIYLLKLMDFNGNIYYKKIIRKE